MIQALVSSPEFLAPSVGAPSTGAAASPQLLVPSGSRAGSEQYRAAQQKQQNAHRQEYLTRTTQNTFMASHRGSESSGITEYIQVVLSPMCPQPVSLCLPQKLSLFVPKGTHSTLFFVTIPVPNSTYTTQQVLVQMMFFILCYLQTQLAWSSSPRLLLEILHKIVSRPVFGERYRYPPSNMMSSLLMQSVFISTCCSFLINLSHFLLISTTSILTDNFPCGAISYASLKSIKMRPIAFSLSRKSVILSEKDTSLACHVVPLDKKIVCYSIFHLYPLL